MTELEKDTVFQAVRAATSEVFSTMLGIELDCGAPYVEANAPGPSHGVVALIGLAGPWIGTGSFSCSAEFACRLYSMLLMSDLPEAINEEVLDAVAEVTNMIIGNVKTSIEKELGALGLSIPTVIFGRNFMTRTIGKNEWMVVPFSYEGERIEVQICLAPNPEGDQKVRHGFVNPHMVKA